MIVDFTKIVETIISENDKEYINKSKLIAQYLVSYNENFLYKFSSLEALLSQD
jgi:hypothetical protein